MFSAVICEDASAILCDKTRVEHGSLFVLIYCQGAEEGASSSLI